MAERLSEKDRIEILMMIGYGERRRTYQEVSNLFNDIHHERLQPIVKSTVCKIFKKYEEMGNVRDKPRSGRPKTATNEDSSLNVLIEVQENHKVSLRQLALNHNIAKGSVQNILRAGRYHPYKIQNHQELMEDDYDRRVEFCERMIEKITHNENFLNIVLFSDEATFCLNGSVNRHNCRYWSDTNPHWMEQIHTQYPQKVNVWAGIIGNHLIGPFFIDGNLNGEKYLDLLRTYIVPSLIQLFPIENLYFQQDGAPPHYGIIVRNFLNETFPERWIGRRGPIEWPARSPDLSPLDFFLWGYLKNRVYVDRPRNLEELKIRIATEMQNIPVEYLQNTLRNCKDRFYICMEVDGQHFEHL